MKFAILASAIALAVTAPATAVTSITYSGELRDLTQWRTASVAKAGHDLGNNNVLGNAGWYIPGNQQTISQPAFIASFAPSNRVYPGNGSYIRIDNPVTTPGASPSTLLTGTFNPFPGGNVVNPTFGFTVGTGAPSLIRVGVMTDNLDNSVFNPSGLRLTSGTVSSAFINLSAAVYNNRSPDWQFFDIVGAQTGDVFSLNVTGGIRGCACVGAVSFDGGVAVNAIPEPASWAMMVVGFGLVGLGVRRRSSAFAA